jgi:hypothetical protein
MMHASVAIEATTSQRRFVMEQTCSENLQLGRLVSDALGEIERLGNGIGWTGEDSVIFSSAFRFISRLALADHIERDSALQQVHSLCVTQRVRTHCSVQTRTLVSCFVEIFFKDVADSRTRQPLIARVLEKRLVELFGTNEAVAAADFIYLHAYMRLKEKALSRTESLRVKPTRYRPNDKPLGLLESL